MAVVESKAGDWHTTACILCSINCGIEVKLGSADGTVVVLRAVSRRQCLLQPLRRFAVDRGEQLDGSRVIGVSRSAAEPGAADRVCGGDAGVYRVGGGNVGIVVGKQVGCIEEAPRLGEVVPGLAGAAVSGLGRHGRRRARSR